METIQIDRVCKQCGKHFLAELRQMYFQGKPHGHRCRVNYCSPECKSARLAEVAALAVHEKASPNMTCPICGKPFHRYKGLIKKSKNRACSRKCYAEIKRREMIGNKYGLGVKQTPERIAHRVSFIMGEKNPAWRGGVTFHKGRGKKKYKYVKCPPDLKEMSNHHGYIAEHRMVLARKLGRPLLRSEVVHHINHNTLDNHPDNLQLFASNADHKLHEGKSGYFRTRNHTNRHSSQ